MLYTIIIKTRVVWYTAHDICWQGLENVNVNVKIELKLYCLLSG